MPDWAAHVRPRLSPLRLSPAREAEIVEELSQHLDDRWRELIACGASPDEATRLALADFREGNLLARYMAPLRQAHPPSPITAGAPSGHWLSGIWQDLRFALRKLWKDRGFAAVSIATLGLGIGAATAIFSLIYNVLLAPFPEKEVERMVFPRIQNVQQGQAGGRQGYTPAEILEFAENNRSLDGIIAASGERVLYRHGEGTEQLSGALVTPGTFEFFGMPALHGRVMQPGDYEPGAPPVVVMRHKTWMARFNGDLSLLNKTLVLNGTARTLIGIMPPRFAWYGADVWIPANLKSQATTELAKAPPRWFLLGLLKRGVSIQQAEADLTVIARSLARSYPQIYPARFTVQIRKRLDSVTSRYEPFEAMSYTVLAAVGLLLLIACSNVANLMLARATAREKEFALRAVLGARRARLVRLLMVESLVIATAGAMLGILAAWGGLKALVVVIPPNLIPAQAVIELNAPVLAFTLCVAVLTTLIFGLAPALEASRRDLNDPLRESGKGVSGGFRGKGLRDALVVMEVALSLTLLVGAGLLMRSFVAQRQLDLGLRANHVFLTVLALPVDRYKTPEEITRFLRPLLGRLKALPGVLDAAVADSIPPYGGAESKIEIAGKVHAEEWRTLFQYVSEEYFRTLRIEFREGRAFSEVEINDARKVAVVNETFVRKYFANESPVGRRVRLGRIKTDADAGHDAWFEIVGVVADVRNRGLDAPIEPGMWVPYTIMGSDARALMVRTSQDPGTIMNAVRQAVWATDSGVALIIPGALEDFIHEQMYAAPRFGFLVMTIFGCIGLILVTVGVYSMLAYSTTQKTHEIGIRIALGAERSAVLGMVVRAGLRLVVAGIAIGITASLVLVRVIKTQLVGVPVYDPPTLAAATLLLTMTAAIACWIPARRAARVDPMVALRYE
jgi:putative ABC transport system permease protein